MSALPSKTWWFAAGLALACGNPPSPPAKVAAPDAGRTCAFAPTSFSSEKAATVPVVLWAVGAVRLYLDDKAAFSPPESPLRLPAGEHALRAEAQGEEPLSTRFRLEPGSPALFHAQVDEGLGITLVRLGAACTSCEFNGGAEVELDSVPSTDTGYELLQAAAANLRADKWRSAFERLRRTPQRDRKKPVYLRLASSLYQQAGRPNLARQMARAIPAARSKDLSGLLAALDALAAKERERSHAGMLQRWNAVTERFGALASKFPDAAPGALGAGGRRLAALSEEFAKAAKAKELRAEQAALLAAEQAVSQLADAIRSSRPADCGLQEEVLATLKP